LTTPTKQLLSVNNLNLFKKIISIYSPFHYSYYDLFPNALKVYVCYDEYRLNSDGIENVEVIKKEEFTLTKSDIVFVTSHMLFESRSKVHKKVFNMGNGVDTDFFSAILKDSCEPSDLKDIPYPRILYIGNLANWIYDEILLYAVEMLPDMQFLFLGPISNHKLAKMLNSKSNVHFLGARDYKDVPLYIKWCDVCISPFKLNDFTVNVNPLKVYEYLYVGKPVVATPLPELLYLENAVLIAEDKKDFVEKIKLALLHSNDLNEIQTRKEVAEKFSLKNIATYICDIIRDESENGGF